MSSDRAVQLNANSTVSATVGLPLVDVCSVSVIAFTICACLESYSNDDACDSASALFVGHGHLLWCFVGAKHGMASSTACQISSA